MLNFSNSFTFGKCIFIFSYAYLYFSTIQKNSQNKYTKCNANLKLKFSRRLKIIEGKKDFVRIVFLLNLAILKIENETRICFVVT